MTSSLTQTLWSSLSNPTRPRRRGDEQIPHRPPATKFLAEDRRRDLLTIGQVYSLPAGAASPPFIAILDKTARDRRGTGDRPDLCQTKTITTFIFAGQNGTDGRA